MWNQKKIALLVLIVQFVQISSGQLNFKNESERFAPTKIYLRTCNENEFDEVDEDLHGYCMYKCIYEEATVYRFGFINETCRDEWNNYCDLPDLNNVTDLQERMVSMIFKQCPVWTPCHKIMIYP